YRHWGNKEDVTASPISTLLSYYIKFHEEVEKNPALDDEAREVFSKLEHGAEEETALWQWFRDESLKEFARVYRMLDIEFDSYAGESFYSDKMGAVLEEMREKGILEKSQGAEIVEAHEHPVARGVHRIQRQVQRLRQRRDHDRGVDQHRRRQKHDDMPPHRLAMRHARLPSSR
ncbi:MAG: arginine--tRNA ligase, partial [Alphaproteobacteria bacterium HGW-Alphaproteobacteria-10]